MRERFVMLVLCGLVLIGVGCGSLLPSSRRDIRSPWDTYDQARAAFEKITPYQTTVADLKELGFHPYVTPNIEILTYLEVIEHFMPNPSIKKSDLEPGLQDCLGSKDTCHAYEMGLEKVKKKRYGNVLLDVFKFKRKTRKSGWRFQALIVIKGDLVVYKLAGGKPQINENAEEKNPLGPLQDAGGVIEDLIHF